MKNFINLLILCICTLSALAQNKESKVTITITDIKPDSIWVADYGATFYAKPDKNNQYVLNFKHDKPLKVRLGFDNPEQRNLTLFLEMGDQLNVVSDFGKNATFSGRGAENERVFFDLTKSFLLAFSHLDMRNRSASAYFDQLMNIGQQAIDLLESNKQKVTPSFYAYQAIAFKYNKLGFAFAPMAPIPYLFQVALGKKASESVPDHYWDIQKEVVLDEKLMENPSYLNFVKYIYPLFLNYKKKYEKNLLDSILSTEENTKITLDEITKNYTGNMRGTAVSATLLSAVKKTKGTPISKALVERYLAQYCSPADQKIVMEAYIKMHNLTTGQIPPSFVLKDLNGKDITLKDFAGKVVYMDFWASWCTPCRAEMKNGAPKLHEKFKDNKDVVFLYISIDSQVADWKKAIADDKIEGVHGLSQATAGVQSPAAKAFDILGIPRYVIIGKDGKIFDNDAPRPSQDITVSKINEALGIHN